MSKIGEQLQRLHRSNAPIGFGFVRTVPAGPRMVVVVHIDGRASEDDVKSAVDCADAVAIEPGAGNVGPMIGTVDGSHPGMPLGAWLEGTARLPEGEGGPVYDFVVCDVDGPSDLLAAKDRGTLIRVLPDVEPVRLRSVGELGVDSVVLLGKDMDLTRLASIIECRRVRSACARPVLLYVSSVLDQGVLVSLWKAGVDGLMVDSALGVDRLTSLREAVNAAPFGARPASGGTVAIGAYVGAHEQPLPDEGEEDDGGEEEEDE